jgi:itaconyl-CoA hydratase
MTARFFEDLAVGDVYRSRLGRTITEADNVWFTTLTMNTNQIHFNVPYAERTQFGKPLVVSTLTLAIVLGLSVADTSENAAANLGWTEIKLPKPVFAGDTLWAETEVLEARESASNPSVGIVAVRTRGLNQRSEVVIEFRRSFMAYKRDAPEVADLFPETEADWSV